MRAQTAPATILLILTPYLINQNFFDIKTLILIITCIFLHYLSFGQNSLMDAAMMYDQKDENKTHHPLLSGSISLHSAHNIIHWGLCLATITAAILTLILSLNPILALAFLLCYSTFGHAYNDGLSKESSFGFLSIALCFTSAAAWGWYLGSKTISLIGIVYLAYVFCTILYQIAWSGFVKEMQVEEKSNILKKMGAHLDIKDKTFNPGKSRFFAYIVKGSGLIFVGILCWLNTSLVRLVWLVLTSFFIAFYLHKTTKTRTYNRDQELFDMSIMEILTIYLPIPIMLEPLEASAMMIWGVVYFFGINLILWGKPYPKV